MKKTPAKPAALSPYLDEREHRINADHEWCANNPMVRLKYKGKIVAVHNRTILGVGKTYATAWAAAKRRRGCPPKHEVAMVVVPYFFPQTPRRRVEERK
jgi:hypothetical protein